MVLPKQTVQSELQQPVAVSLGQAYSIIAFVQRYVMICEPLGNVRSAIGDAMTSKLPIRLSILATVVAAQVLTAAEEHPVSFPPVAADKIRSYAARRIAEPIQVDGRLDEDAWLRAKKSDRFVDLITGERTIHDTRVMVLWDEEYLYVGYQVEEPFLAASLKNRDDPVYENNDVELFVAGQHAYYEFEINSFGTIYEGLFVWKSAYDKFGFHGLPQLDRRRPETGCQEFNGVGLTNHPRGLRWAFLGWDFPGLKAKVQLDGSINDDSDRDRGWTVELALPWAGMKTIMHADGRAIPPNDGDEWRIHFSRFNQYKEASPAKDSGGWALSPHGVWDSHVPECFPRVKFCRE